MLLRACFPTPGLSLTIIRSLSTVMPRTFTNLLSRQARKVAHERPLNYILRSRSISIPYSLALICRLCYICTLISVVFLAYTSAMAWFPLCRNCSSLLEVSTQAKICSTLSMLVQEKKVPITRSEVSSSAGGQNNLIPLVLTLRNTNAQQKCLEFICRTSNAST